MGRHIGTYMRASILFPPGESIVVTDPEGTFDSSRLSSASNVVLIAAGTGKQFSLKKYNTFEYHVGL